MNHLTPTDIARVRAKYPVSEATARRNIPFADTKVAPKPKPNVKTIVRKTTDEARLNKTEKRYLAWLLSLAGDNWIGIQNITLKLADDCRLTMDFAAADEQGLRLIDTKAFDKRRRRVLTREDALIKIRCAARMFPLFRFLIAHEENGVWIHHEIKP